ncbi:MAG: peptide MFS transporter [Paludibacteraceae bacterium]|nr:peptide MFS transporter [Candidatus Colicola coprequi]MCQ2333680.1 peptide MFS transporter [Paludibacteraceae bacterium]
MFENQPKGLFALALANTGERFGYYTMLAVFALFLRANFGLAPGTAGIIYSSFLGLVYFLPLVGGILADKIGYGKCVTIGIIVMFLGYVLLAIPLGGIDNGSVVMPMIAMFTALALISFGTGLFKGNLQVMVGNLYDDPKYADRRDAAFSIFYMAINIGAMFAPTAAVKIMAWAQTALGTSVNDSYHFAFAIACLSLILSIAIYYACRPWFRHVENTAKQAAAAGQTVEQLTPEQTKKRITALCLVFAVVIFFWMAFHQNGLTLTYFANEFVNPLSTGIQSMAFDIFNLVAIVIIVYGLFSLIQSKKTSGKIGGASAIVLAAVYLGYKYLNISAEGIQLAAPIFQQFNPFYVVALTPISMAIFGALAKHGKEPSAPRKIAYGMLVAAVAYVVMALFSMNLLSPAAQELAKVSGDPTFANANLLIGVYLILTFGELLLSPMGISFVSKVAPPQYKGMMMGLWFVATAVGNLLVSVGGFLWGELPLAVVWGVFVGVCLVAAIFMFSMMKKLEDATK